jgi:hypothetical protein
MAVTFIAQRISSKGNVLFPDKITIEDTKVTYYKGEIIGYKSLVISRMNIASMFIEENVFFADVVIESKGGQKMTAKGFLKSDAREIVNLLMI